MRIGIDGHMLGDHSGGNESFYTNILRNMTPAENQEIFLFIKKGVDVSELKNKFRIVEFKEQKAIKRNFLELPRLCKKYKLDLLHTQYFIPINCPCKVVCTIHDICFEHYKNIFTKKEYLRQKILIPYAAKHSEFIYTVSEHAKKDIIEHYKIEPQKVIVTYNAVGDEFRKLNSTELNEAELRKKFGIGDSEFILSVGNLQPRKNLPRLIKAFNNYVEHGEKNIKLVIVGKKAWLFDDILKEACNNTGKIIFTDYVTNKDLVRLYNAAKCFIYPSFFEGFGIPPLEAMACGTPVAVAKATSLPEVVGNAGLYFDPFDVNSIEKSIVTMFNEDIDDYLMKAKEQVKKFSWRKSAELIIDSYIRAMDDKKNDKI